MSRKLAITLFALLVALPAFADTRQPPAAQPRAAQPSSALHLMSDSEFLLFLKRLDTAVLQWQAQLRNVDLKSLGLDSQESGDLHRSYGLCLRSLDNTREEVQALSQKQTLKGDFLLLVDLNDLARGLDGLDRDLANAAATKKSESTQKLLGYARGILGVDTALALHAAEFQRHVFAYVKVIDATLEQAETEPSTPPSQE